MDASVKDAKPETEAGAKPPAAAGGAEPPQEGGEAAPPEMKAAAAEIPAEGAGGAEAPANGGGAVVPESKSKAGVKPKTIADGADSEAETAAKDKAADDKHKSYWPDDWREKWAEHYAAGDKKAYDKELRRLQRITDPAGVYGMYREMEGRLHGGGLIKVPGKDAKPEEIAEFHKALGVPEKPEDYFNTLKLDNGAVIGDADRPLVDGFASAVHKSGATPQFVNAALNWYYSQQEETAAAMDERDDAFRRESERALKEEFGPSFRRLVTNAASLYAGTPGGGDIANPESFRARMMSARFPDGSIVGNDPDFIRWQIAINQEINPASSVVEDGDQSGMSIDAEIASLEKFMRDDRRAWYKDEAKQARHRELLTAREKLRARAR